jgi:NAD+ kinase
MPPIFTTPLDFSLFLSFKFNRRTTKYGIITMKVALSGIDTRDGALLSKVKRTLESLSVKTQIMKDDDYYRTAKEADLVMVAGGDRGILDYFHKIEYDSPPVLGIYETDSTGFLAQLDARELLSRGGLSACRQSRRQAG